MKTQSNRAYLDAYKNLYGQRRGRPDVRTIKARIAPREFYRTELLACP